MNSLHVSFQSSWVNIFATDFTSFFISYKTYYFNMTSLLVNIMSSSKMIIQVVNIAEMFSTKMAVHSNYDFMQGCNMSFNTVGVQHFATKLALNSSIVCKMSVFIIFVFSCLNILSTLDIYNWFILGLTCKLYFDDLSTNHYSLVFCYRIGIAMLEMVHVYSSCVCWCCLCGNISHNIHIGSF